MMSVHGEELVETFSLVSMLQAHNAYVVYDNIGFRLDASFLDRFWHHAVMLQNHTILSIFFRRCVWNHNQSLLVWRCAGASSRRNRYNGNLPTCSTDTALNWACPRCTDQSAESPTFGSHLLTRPPVEQSRWFYTEQSNAPAVGPSPTAVIIGPRVPFAHVLNLHQADLGVRLHGMG